MDGHYQYTPYIWPSLLAVALLVALAIYSWRRRAVPGARVLAASCLIAVPWVAGAVMETVAVDPATKIFWFRVQGAWQLPAVTAITCFVLEYAWPGRWLTRRNLALLSIPPLLLLGLILTNDLHHRVWRGFAIDGTVIPLRGPANWTFVAYAYGLGILHLVVLAWLFVRSPQHRWPVAFMFAGGIVGRVLYFLEAARVLPSGLPFNVPPIAFEYGMYAIALFGFRIFDPIAAACQVVIAQMREGVLVLDLEGRVASLNPAAERILRLPVKEATGQPVRELLPAHLEGPLADPAGAGLELSLPAGGQVDGQAGQEVRQYVLEISPLTDWRGLEIGRLLLLRDVTERRQAQAQLLEQQRSLAMLREREHLARELHDSIGQVLGFASLKTGAARKLIADGKLANADDQLAHLESIMADAHADVREYILNLHTAPTEERPFFLALQHYLAGYRQNYGFQVDLSIGAGVDDGRLPPEAQMQLFRILQEALSNARKHAETNSVQVSFVREGGMLRLCIQDNGQGFEPQQAAAAEAAQTPGGHFGLRFMRERAEQMGGTLRLDSAPGQGTCVTVDLPVEMKS